MEEIHPEYTVGTKKVDYSLRFENHNKAFIEVKKIGTDLEKHQEQLLSYSFQEGVRLAILTNGVTWWFYLPIHEGSWERRKFYTIEIYDQAAEEIAQKFEEFLGKENVISGEAIGNAERVFASKQKRDIIRSTIPKAWNKLVTEPDEDLIQLVAEMTERLSGYKPDHPTVAALSSLIIVGLGHFYIGKWWRGLGFMALAILFFWATIPISGLGVIAIYVLAPLDAYDQAEKHNIKYGYSEEAIGEAEHGEEEGLRPQELWVEG